MITGCEVRLSKQTLRPLGPNVEITARSRSEIPSSILSRASLPNSNRLPKINLQFII